MNAQRRKALKAVITKLEDLESLRQEIKEELEDIMDEEQESFDNMPEGLQESDRGQQMQEYISTMEGAIDDLDSMDIDGLTDQLREIAE